MSKKNEVAKVEETSAELALAGELDWGAGIDLQIDDLQIPKLLILQFMSPQVTKGDGTLRAGQIVDSIESKVFGDEKKSIELLIFDTFKTWKVKTDEEKPRRVRVEPLTFENADAPLAWEENGQKLKRDKVINYYCLNLGENVATSLPFVLSLSRSSMNVAKALNTMIARLKKLGKNSAASSFILTTKREEKDGNVFFVADIKAGRPTTADEIIAAKTWWDDINRGKLKVTVREGEHDDDSAAGGPF